ncbi:MAG TPA: hypothetical protein VHE53_03670 [Patescibacteria group bacterium]|nr:hypothetical protein [Patescibacteria group bacterium]
MITVPDATKKIIERSRYLSEAISKGLINYSALARYIKPELEKMLIKDVSEASIVMALKRLEKDFKPKYRYNNIFKSPPEITMRSNLIFLAISGAGRYLPETKSILFKTDSDSQTSMIVDQEFIEKPRIPIDYIQKQIDQVSVISIKLPSEALATYGVFYFFLKSLAWEAINIIEFYSTLDSINIVVGESDSERSLAVIRSLVSGRQDY